MEQKYLQLPWNMGAYLHDRRLAVVVGTFSQMITGNAIINTVECVPYDLAVLDRLRFTFWSFKKLNSAGEYDEFLTVIVEEKLL